MDTQSYKIPLRLYIPENFDPRSLKNVTWDGDVPILPAFHHPNPDRKYTKAGFGLWTVWCSWCVTWHTHGERLDLPVGYRTHRWAHCSVDSSPMRARGYLLELDGRRYADVKPAMKPLASSWWYHHATPAVLRRLAAAQAQELPRGWEDPPPALFAAPAATEGAGNAIRVPAAGVVI